MPELLRRQQHGIITNAITGYFRQPPGIIPAGTRELAGGVVDYDRVWKSLILLVILRIREFISLDEGETCNEDRKKDFPNVSRIQVFCLRTEKSL